MPIQSPEGTYDLLPEDAHFWEHFKSCAYQVFGRFGYEAIETPLFEQTDLFVRGIGEATDVVSKEMFRVVSGGNLEKLLSGGSIKAKSNLSLRPEGTAGIVRALVQHDLVPQGAAPAKLMYAGPMFRAERPQKGRLRQFRQIGVECLGAEDPSVDAEAIIMLMEFFSQIGIPLDSMRLLLNSMGCDSCRPAYRKRVAQFLRDHEQEVCEECNKRAQINPLRAFDCKNAQCSQIMEDAPKITDYLCEHCQEHYAQVKAYLDQAGIQYVEDTRLVRGLDYYTRTVFEVQVDNGMGSQNAIGGGGRYDKLAENLEGRPTPGLGFALGYERCVLALEAAGVETKLNNKGGIFIACADAACKQEVFGLVLALRQAGFKAEMDHQARSLKSQFKLANKLGVDGVITIGPDELESGSLILRDMNEHTEHALELTALKKRLQMWAELPYNRQLHVLQDLISE